MKVKDKVIIVTGGGNGLGRALVLNLLEKDAKIIAVDMNKTALEETVALSERNEKTLITCVADITDKTALEFLFEKAMDSFGGVDGIINNAGIIQPFVKLVELDENVIERIVNVNFFGTVNVTKTFLPHLLTRPEAHIVNISSLGGILPTAGQIIYCASKAAIKQLSDCLRSELSETNVHVTSIFPGAMATSIKVNSGLIREWENTDYERMKNTMQPVVAAEKIVKAMQRNRTHVYIGKDSKSMNFIYKISPKLATQMIYNQVKYKFEKDKVK
jgi:short-subunit dehydrogenase